MHNQVISIHRAFNIYQEVYYVVFFLMSYLILSKRPEVELIIFSPAYQWESLGSVTSKSNWIRLLNLNSHSMEVVEL